METVAEWVLALALGGILGMIGQGVRVIAGLKKVNDLAQAEGQDFNSLFQGTTLGISLLIGFVAGSLAIIAFSTDDGLQKFTKEIIFAIIGAGYAGTDFIETFIRKSLPAVQRTPSSSAFAVGNDSKPAVG